MHTSVVVPEKVHVTMKKRNNDFFGILVALLLSNGCDKAIGIFLMSACSFYRQLITDANA